MGFTRLANQESTIRLTTSRPRRLRIIDACVSQAFEIPLNTPFAYRRLAIDGNRKWARQNSIQPTLLMVLSTG
jgi:hypothetical protein